MSPAPKPYFGITTQQAETQLARWLLPHRLKDLEERMDPAADRYTKLGISMILRSLILDGMNVESLARNRGAIQAPVFEYTPYSIQKQSALGGLHWMGDGAPVVMFAVTDEKFMTPSVRSGLRDFQAATVGQIESHPLSLAVFIRAYAHVLGGVHLGRPKNKADELLQAAAVAIDQSVDGWSTALQHIGAVTHRALTPILESPEF